MEAILKSASLPSFDPDEWIVIFFTVIRGGKAYEIILELWTLKNMTVFFLGQWERCFLMF